MVRLYALHKRAREDYVYLPFNGGKEVVTCPLTPAAKAFRGRDWDETRDYFARETVDADLSRSRQIQGKAKTHAIQNYVIEEATKKTEQARKLTGKQSKAAQTSGIRANRTQEKQRERLFRAWKPGVENKSEKDSSANNLQNSVDIYVPPLSNINKIREIRKQLKGGRNE